LKPVDGLTLDVAGTFLDTEVVSDFDNFGGFGRPINLKGSSFPYTPETSLQAGARYDFSISDSISAYAVARASYQDDTIAAFGADQPSPDPAVTNLTIDSYTLVDLAFGVNVNDQWGVELWGRNVTDEYYWTNATYTLDSVGRSTGRPAEWGLTVKAEF
jgi:outer membrane receptor protein involved in Fe transport